MNDEPYVCQATDLVYATSSSSKGFMRWVCDMRSQNVRIFNQIRMFVLWWNYKIQNIILGKKYTNFSTFLLNKMNLCEESQNTPTTFLNLQPGDLVEVRSRKEILATLNAMGKNRGLEFIPEMLKFCGKRYRVLKRLDKMIIEDTGKMRQIANTVLLKGIYCDGKAHLRCQRTCYCLWREIWLKKIG